MWKFGLWYFPFLRNGSYYVSANGWGEEERKTSCFIKRLELFFSFAWTLYLNAISPNSGQHGPKRLGVKVSTKINGQVVPNSIWAGVGGGGGGYASCGQQHPPLALVLDTGLCRSVKDTCCWSNSPSVPLVQDQWAVQISERQVPSGQQTGFFAQTPALPPLSGQRFLTLTWEVSQTVLSCQLVKQADLSLPCSLWYIDFKTLLLRRL